MRALINRFRLARGLRWQADMPRPVELGIDLQNMLVLALIGLGYFFVGMVQETTEAKIAQQRAIEQAERTQSAMIACLNGGAPGYYTRDESGAKHYIVCGETWTMTWKD